MVFPLKYLGGMLFKGRQKICYFSHLLDAIQACLSGWISKCHLILVQHVLSLLPLHVFAVLDPSKSLLHSFESKFALFLREILLINGDGIDVLGMQLCPQKVKMA